MLKPNERSISKLAPRLAAGYLSAVTLLNSCLQAIADHDGTLGAVLTLDPRASDEAKACDEEQRVGHTRGPLHGIPIIIKDNINVAGLPVTSGNLAMAKAMPQRDASQVVRLRAAGAIIIGKSNLSEFSFEIRSRSSLGGDVRNPFNLNVTAGGSSGGTAAAVASGFAIAGLGTDTGGSIRVPAAFNGLVGLRPTQGLLDIQGIAPLAPSTDTVAPIARSINDAALMFEVMNGQETSVVTRVQGLRVGVLRQLFGECAEIGGTAENAIEALHSTNVFLVDPVALPLSVLPIDRPHIVDLEFAAAFDLYLATNFVEGTAPASLRAIIDTNDFLPEYADDLQRRMKVDPRTHDDILRYHAELSMALISLFDEHGLDALLYPTSMVLPSSLDNPKGGWGPELAACSGWPALSVPGGVSRSGLPIGIELLGRARSETLLLALGAAIERSVSPRPIPKFGR